MPSTYASIRSQFSGVTAIATSGGSLTGSGTIYLFAQGRNRAGRNLLSDAIAVAYSADQKIQVTFPSAIRGSADELIEVVVSSSSTSDPLTAKRIASWRLKNILTIGGVNYPGQGANRLLPYTLELTQNAHLSAGAIVANTGALPTGSNRIHGMIRYVTASAQYLRYDSEAIAGVVASSPGYWVLSSQAELETYIASTTVAGGCDRPLSALSPASVLIPPPYAGDNTESYSLTYWYSNGLAEDGGAIATAGTRLAFQFLVNGTNQSHLFSGRAIARLQGYVRRSDGSLNTAIAGVGSAVILDGSSASMGSPYLSGVSLPSDLLRGYAAVYSVSLKFSLDEITQGMDGYRLAEGSTFSLLIFPIGQLGTPDPFGKAIAGSFVYAQGQRLRILPDTIGIKRMPGQGSIQGYSFSALNEQVAIAGLLPDTADQIVAINGALAGECIIRQAIPSLLANEAVRAIASTQPGTCTPAAYTSPVSITTENQVISVGTTYPSAIRQNYPDVVKGVEAIFNVPKIRVYVQDTGSGIIYLAAEVSPTPNTQTIVITSLGATTVASLPANADPDFCLFDYVAVGASVGSGLSSIPIGTYRVAIAYHFPSGNTALTAVSHDPGDGCIRELSSLGVNAYTATTSDFVQPAALTSQSVGVANAEWIAVGQTLYVETGGYYQVMAIDFGFDFATLTLLNLGSAGNAAAGSTVASNSKVSAAGAPASKAIATLSASSSPVALDLRRSNTFELTTAIDLTISNPTNLINGQQVAIAVASTSGTRSITLSSSIVLPDGEANPFSVAAGKQRILTCVARSNKLYCTISGAFTA